MASGERLADMMASAVATERVGKFEVAALLDGTIENSFDIATGIEPEEARRVSKSLTDRVSMPAYGFLLSFDGKCALIDTGASDTMGPGLGKLVNNLRALGVEPAAIDYIFLTHLHPDHSNGLVDSNGRPFYPNAEVFVHELEARFWLDREISRGTPQRLHKNIRATKRATDPYRDRLHAVNDTEVMPGISALLCTGHTPGHCAWLLRSEGKALLSWGDLVHMPGLQISRPDVGVIYDLDPAAAARTRIDMFGRIARDRAMIAGAHLDQAFAYLVADGDHYRLEPA